MSIDLAQSARWRTLALPNLFERGGLETNKPALVFQNSTRTYGEMRNHMRRVARGLDDLGIRPGDRVAVLSTNRLEYLEIECGIAAACAIMVPINWRLKPMEVGAILRRSGARAIFVEDKTSDTVFGLRSRGEIPKVDLIISLDGDRHAELGYLALLGSPSAAVFPAEPHFEDPHEIIFTSGTTGQPKGVVWTNGGLLFNSMQQIIDYRIGPESSTYAMIDLHYIGGRHDFTWPVLHAGGTVHIKESSGFDAKAALSYVCDHRISHVLWVPTMVFEILRVDDLDRFDMTALRMIMCGGAPVSANITSAMQERFSNSDFVQVYGLTEGGGSVTCMPGHMAAEKPGSAGRPSVHVVIRIVDDEGRDLPASHDGEIWVRAPSMTAGYWDEPQLTQETLQDDWLRTGDIGHLDGDGYLYVTGRKKDMIISGGMNIYPSEIEDILRGHPAVADVSVIGLPHEKWGEQVCAVIELVEGRTVSQSELISYCSDRLAGFKKPSLVHFVASMPRTSSGKPQKFALRQMFSAATVS
jgi:fatty-acyl-CoA synthase